MNKRALIAFVTMSTFQSESVPDQPYFTGIGDLSGGEFSSHPLGISGDGRVVVGISSSSRGRYDGYRWTREGGMVALPDIDGLEEVQIFAQSASYDGTVIVGDVLRADGNVKAFRWTEETGMIDLGDLPGGGQYPYSAAEAVSRDGTVVGGESVSKESFPRAEAFIWTEADGMRSCGLTPDGYRALAINDLNGDGSVGTTTGSSEALVWRVGSGWEFLPRWEGSFGAESYGISDDGSTVVGAANVVIDDHSDQRPFRWTEEEGMIDLGRFPDGSWVGRAVDASADGSVIVGRWTVSKTKLFIWDAENGLRDLKAVLTEEYGFDLQNKWKLVTVEGISDDGQTVFGEGIHFTTGHEGWVAHIPTCNPFKYPVGDSNGSGTVDFDDIDCFVGALINKEAWQGCGTLAPSKQYACVNDLSQDGKVDFNDIDAFIDCLINNGCP